MSKFYITTAIDYANSAPHIGTAYEKIGADAIARWKRLTGHDVYFLMGNDEHSQNVATRAKELGLEPAKYCDDMEQRFKTAWAKLSISYSRFIRTTEPAHTRACQEVFRRIRAKGDIFKGKYSGLYCVGCEARKTEKELVNGRCKDHPGQAPEFREEDNYFFRLSKYRDEVLRRIEANPSLVEPAVRRNEILNVLREGLEDISISRAKTNWGVPIPDDPDHVMYVWFDALINYITGAGFPDDSARFGALWPADLHVIGKDITRFHCIIWPAMLLAAGIEPARHVFAHGFVYIGGRKISKSDPSTRVDPIEMADTYGGDALRYFLLREVSFHDDGEFTMPKFVIRNNSDLADDLGNLLNRVVSMTERYLGGVFSSRGAPLPQNAPLQEHLLTLADRITPMMDACQFHAALTEIWESVRRTNTYIEETSPWKLHKAGKLEEIAGILYNAAEALRILAVLVSPVLALSAPKIWDQLGLEGMTGARLHDCKKWEGIGLGTRVKKATPLFPKIELLEKA